MKAITSNEGQFGPFNSVDVKEDRFICDGQEFPFSSLSDVQIVEADTLNWPQQPESVPFSITRRQARQKLYMAGLLSSVEAAINSIPDVNQKQLATIEWEDSQVFERNRPLLIAIGTALGLNSEQLDSLFIEASKL